MILFVKDTLIVNAKRVTQLTLSPEVHEVLLGLFSRTTYKVIMTYETASDDTNGLIGYSGSDGHIELEFNWKRHAQAAFNDIAEQIRFHARDDVQLTQAFEAALGDEDDSDSN